MDWDVIIIGGGAAGLQCAITAGRRGRTVLVLEHAERVGKKILMSGGGRCNFTNLYVTAQNYLSGNPHFCKSALARYTQWDFIADVERHGIAYHEKELGQLFCDVSSKLIVQMLVAECAAAGVRIETGCSVESITRPSESRSFQLRTGRGAMTAAAVVVASGGLSIPKMGATGFGSEVAGQFGHPVTPLRAGLVPLTLSGRHLEDYADLAGVALPVETICDGTSFRAGMLVTHRGLSGPAILQASSYWEPGNVLLVNLLPDIPNVEDVLLERQSSTPAVELRTVLSDLLPRRFAQRICELHFQSKPMRQYRRTEIDHIGRLLNAWTVTASGTEGYRTAEVTLGGVDTESISSSTMESKRTPGLYFVGEVVDVTGHLGGFNFQWAWASGYAAGRVA